MTAQTSAAETTADATGAADFEAVGIDPAQVRSLRAAVLAAQQRFLDSLLEHVNRWEIDGAELHLYFPPEHRSLADMLQNREAMEKLRSISNQVLGQSFRVCVKLGASRAAVAPAASVSARNSGSESGVARDKRAESEQNPAVRAVLDRFGGRIAGVKPAGGS